jgi:hypothetical protein
MQSRKFLRLWEVLPMRLSERKETELRRLLAKAIDLGITLDTDMSTESSTRLIDMLTRLENVLDGDDSDYDNPDQLELDFGEEDDDGELVTR